MAPRKCHILGIFLIITLLLIVVYQFIAAKPSSTHWHLEQSTRLLEYSYLRNSTISENQTVWRIQVNETDCKISYGACFSAFWNDHSKMNTTKVKLIYQIPDANYGDPPSEGRQLFASQKCPVEACSITRKLKEAKVADAVYLEGFKASMLKELLPKSKKQMWIIIGGESPPLNSRLGIFDSQALGNLINWTIFYRRDSTISMPYGKFETFPNFTRIEDYPLDAGINYAAGKSKQVAWFVSNCNLATNSGRDNYANELSKYIQVDIYGACGKLKCPKNEMDGCLQMLRKEYKFYLSFENNCCKDYITEKFFRNALHNDVIPIALGAHPKDYKALAPPESYIHVDDFESPKQLADYLHLLDKNDTLYNEYFRWKRTGNFVSESTWCRLCALLHAIDDESYVHWYPDFHKWWDEDVCLEHPKPGYWQSWRNNM